MCDEVVVEEVVVPETLDMEEEVVVAPSESTVTEPAVMESAQTNLMSSPLKKSYRQSVQPKSFSPTFSGPHAEVIVTVPSQLATQLEICDACNSGKRKAHTRKGSCKLAKPAESEEAPLPVDSKPVICQESEESAAVTVKGSKKRGAAAAVTAPAVPVVCEVEELPPVSATNKRAKKGSTDPVLSVAEVEPEATEEPTKGKRKASKAPAPAPKPAKSSKKSAVVEEEEEALVLICDGCEKEFFYDELYPNGEFEIPDGDWFCTSCVPAAGKKKNTKAAPKKVANVESPVPVAKGRGKASATAKIEEAKEEPRRTARRK
jgi:hypothetical protein